MTETPSGDQKTRPFSQEAWVTEIVKAQVARAERAFNQAFTSIWIGNGGAAVASMSFLTNAGPQSPIDAHRHAMLVPLGMFVGGLIFSGIGSIISLVSDSRTIARIENAKTFLDVLENDAAIGSVTSLRFAAGLTIRNPRAVTGVVAGLLFALGCIVGIVGFWNL